MTTNRPYTEMGARLRISELVRDLENYEDILDDLHELESHVLDWMMMPAELDSWRSLFNSLASLTIALEVQRQ